MDICIGVTVTVKSLSLTWYKTLENIGPGLKSQVEALQKKSQLVSF